MNLDDFHEVTIPVPWGHIAGRWYGNQMQRPLVALHGWLDNCGSFARLAPLLTPYTSLLCIDLPGHGLSTHLPNGIVYHHSEYVRTLLRLMKSYKWDKISLMGHSMGGIIAFMFASIYPDRVDMIIALDILKHRYLSPKIEPVMISLVLERTLLEGERLSEDISLNEPPSYTFDECIQLLYEATQHSVELQNCRYILERNLAKSQKYPSKYYFSRDGRLKNIAMFNPNIGMARSMVERICGYEIPYLVIRGGQSTNIEETTMTEIVPLFKKLNKNFEFSVVEGGTHHLHLNNANIVANLIVDFWKRKSWQVSGAGGASAGGDGDGEDSGSGISSGAVQSVTLESKL